VPITGADGGTTAAQTFGWGQPTLADEFTGNLNGWGLYNGAGHNNQGRRSPSAATVANGVLTISGDPAGTTEGMAWSPGAKYGRWEARVASPAGDSTYHPVLLLWPDAENWPVGGEVDFMEISDASRRNTDFFLHYSAANNQEHGSVAVDATQWHNWAVEWAPDHISAFVDGKVWYTTTDTSHLPPGPMHMTIQLDWFPDGGSVQPSSMSVDWVHYYPITGAGTSGAPVNNAAAVPGVQSLAPASRAAVTAPTTSAAPTTTTTPPTTTVTPTTTTPTTTSAPPTTTSAPPDPSASVTSSSAYPTSSAASSTPSTAPTP
jgi:Glycosyl hydrolases family 16